VQAVRNHQKGGLKRVKNALADAGRSIKSGVKSVARKMSGRQYQMVGN
jgi:hypothetical protein